MEETSDEEEEEVAAVAEGDDDAGDSDANGNGSDDDDSDSDLDTRLKCRLLSAQAKERVAALSDKCRLLTAENEKLMEEVKDARSSLQDISEVLTAEVAAKTATVADLERQLADALADGERVRMSLEKELADERASFKRELAELGARTEEAESKLKEVRDFAERKGHLDEQLAQARAELAQQRKDHEDAIGSMERSIVQDKDKLRREAAAKVKEARAAMMALTESQLDTATRATIAENEGLSTELRYTSKRAEKLLAQVEKLTADNAALKRELDISKQLAGELARKQCLSAKTVSLLSARVAGQHEAHQEVEEAAADLREETRELGARVDTLERQLETARQDAAHFRSLSESQAAELAAAAAHEDEAVHFLRACLADVREQIVAVTSSSSAEEATVVQGGLDELALHQRCQALEYFCRKLAAYQAVKGGAPSSFPVGTARVSAPLLADPSITQLLALSMPLTHDPTAAAVAPTATTSSSPSNNTSGRKQHPAGEAEALASQLRGARDTRGSTGTTSTSSITTLEKRGLAVKQGGGFGRPSCLRTAGTVGSRGDT